MNEILRTIMNRRACRSFKPDLIPEDILQQILEAGTYAATGMGKQSPIIIMVTNQEIRDELSALNQAVYVIPMSDSHSIPPCSVRSPWQQPDRPVL